MVCEVRVYYDVDGHTVTMKPETMQHGKYTMMLLAAFSELFNFSPFFSALFLISNF